MRNKLKFRLRQHKLEVWGLNWTWNCLISEIRDPIVKCQKFRGQVENNHFQGYKRRRFEPLFITFSRPGTDSTGNQNRLGPRLPWTSPRLLIIFQRPRWTVLQLPLFLLKETEAFVPHDREARTHEQRPSSGFIKAREGHKMGRNKERRTTQKGRNPETGERRHWKHIQGSREPARKNPEQFTKNRGTNEEEKKQTGKTDTNRGREENRGRRREPTIREHRQNVKIRKKQRGEGVCSN